MAFIKLPIDIPELEVLMATVQEVLAEVQGLKAELAAKFDAIDNAIEALRGQVAAGQIDQATLDQLAGEVASARASVEAVNPEDPSGDDAPAPGPQDPPVGP